MKQLVRETVEAFVRVVFIAFLLALYLMVGVVLAVPYAFAAGGANADALVGLALFAPIGVFCLLVCWHLRSIGQDRGGWVVFWGALLYVNLPILLNGLSLLLDYVGFGASAHYVHLLRYWSLLLVPAMTMLALSTRAAVTEFIEKVKRKKPQSPLEVG